jgi:hypothetical protein
MLRFAVLSLVVAWVSVARAADCNLNGIDDAAEISTGGAADCNANGVPDACDVFPLAFTASAVPLAASGGAVVSAELTGDRPRDLAVLDPGAGTVTILAGAGDGTFATAGTVTVGSGPEAIAASSLAASVLVLGSDIDLMVANGAGNSVSVLRNGGDGTFTNVAGSPFTLAGHPNGIAVGDLDGDGEPDLVVSMRDAGGVAVLVNDGSGGIMPPGYFKATGAGPQTVLLADLDGDLRNDALVANRTDGTVSYLHNHLGSSFDTAVIVATVGDPAAMALADVDADGDLDFGVLDGVDGSVHLFLGDGTGSFTAGATIATAADATALQLVDMDGNGSPDLVVTTRAGDAVVLALSDVGGTFGRVVAVPAGDGPAGVATGDFDGDGRTDLAVADGLASQVTVLRAADAVARDCDANAVLDACEAPALDCNANGIGDTCDATSPVAFAPRVDTVLDGIDTPLAVGDLDGDGRADVVLRLSPAKVEIALGQADGTLVDHGSFVLPGTPSRVLLADVDGDGHRDVVATSSSGNGVYVLRTDGHGGVVGNDVYSEPNAPFAVGAGEFTGDARLDLLVAETGTSALRVLPGGSGGFTLGASIALAGLPVDLVVGDVDHDGDTDAVVLVVSPGPATALQIVRNAGGMLAAEPPIHATTAPMAILGLAGADFDGDGDMDLALVRLNGLSGVVSVQLALADTGGYVDRQTLPFVQLGGPVLGVVPVGLLPAGTAADVDGDGHPDVVWPRPGGGGVAVFRSHGDDTLEPAKTVAVGGPGFVRGAGVGDVTGDGAPDLVVPESGSPDVVAVLAGLARPVVDTNADGVPDCRQEIRCGDCTDDDGDGLVDGADPDCPGTSLQIRRVVVAPAHKAKPARAKLVADAAAPTTVDPAATEFGFGIATAPPYCGTPALRAHGKRVVRLDAPDGALAALVVQSRPKGKGLRMRAAISLDVAPAAGDVVRAWMATSGSAYRGETTLRAKGKRLVGP